MEPVAAIIVTNSPTRAEHLLVIDIPALVPAALTRAKQVSVWCDDIRDAAQVPSELLRDRLDEAALSEVDLVWSRLPQALGALDEYAESLAAGASAGVRLVAGGREKHLNRSMNRVLGNHFGVVSASLGQRKSRALLASGPIPAPASWPRQRELVVGGQVINLNWHGATFAAGRIDAGTQLLIDHLESVADADSYLDLGCGSGLLATLLARMHPQAAVHAVDASWAAVDATRLTSAGTRVETHWACDLAGFGDASLDVVVCNPPFHRGPAKDSTPALLMFAEAARVLGPGSEFWCVFNSHLPWRSHLARLIGPTRLVAQDRHYTLTRSVRQPTP